MAEGKLVICETNTSTWSYHIREVGPEGPKPGGGAGPALCGQDNMGWDMEGWDLKHYGTGPGHLPMSWCKECGKLAKIPGF